MIKAGRNKALSLFLVVAMVLMMLPVWAVPAFAASSVTAAGKPELKRNTINQDAADITITEGAASDWGSADFTIELTLPDQVTFTQKPTATVNGSATTVSLPSSNKAVVNVSPSTAQVDSVTVSGFKYDVVNPPTGDIDVAVKVNATGEDLSVANAFVDKGLGGTANTPTVIIGANNQAADDVTVTESDPGTLAKDSTLTVMAPVGTTFSTDITMTVTSGDIGFSPLEKVNDSTYVTTVTAASTVASTFVISSESSILYDISSAVAEGLLKLKIQSSQAINGPDNYIEVANAEAAKGVLLAALSKPNVEAGKTNQLAGNIEATETAPGQIATDTVISFTLPDGFTYYAPPSATVTAGDLTFTNPTASLSSDRKTASWTVSGSSSVTATVQFTDFYYNVDAAAPAGDVNVQVGFASDVKYAPSTVANANVIKPGAVTITPDSAPTMNQGDLDKAAGNINITESDPGLIQTGNLDLVLPTGVSFSVAPTATATGQVQLANSQATLINPQTARWTVTTASTSTASSIKLQNIRYNVSTTAPAGPVTVTVKNAGWPDKNVVNANIAAVQNIEVRGIGRPIIDYDVNQPGGKILLIEKTAGAIDETITIELLDAMGITFAGPPTVQVTTGDLVMGSPVVSDDGKKVTIPVTAASTTPSQVQIKDIRYNVTSAASDGNVLVEVKKGTATVTLAVLVNATVGIPITFTDVPSDFWAMGAIDSLANLQIFAGFPDGTFRPNDDITRAEFAKVAVLAAGLSLIEPATPSFNDVPKEHWAYKYIETAKAAGIVQGYGDGTYRPNNKITRAEIARIIYVAAGFAADTSGSQFPDVPNTHWAFTEIMTCKNKGIVSGYPDNMFRPNNNATRAEAATMLYRWLTM